MTVGERIKEARKKAGLTQQQLGEKLGVSAAMIRSYESGRRNPKQETLSKFANALGVRAEYMSGDSPYRTEEELKDKFAKFDTETDRFMQAFENIEERLHELKISYNEQISNLLREDSIAYNESGDYEKHSALQAEIRRLETEQKQQQASLLEQRDSLRRSYSEFVRTRDTFLSSERNATSLFNCILQVEQLETIENVQELQARINIALKKLNLQGLEKAVERIEELALIPKYTTSGDV